MSPTDAARTLEQVARDLDLVVFRLEQPPRASADEARARLRRELEALRDRVEAVARGLD